MIEALVSGQAARVAFIEGQEVSFFEAETPNDRKSIKHSLVSRIFLDADDVEVLKVARYEDVYGILLRKYNLDRALRLLDIALSADDEPDVRSDAAACFSEIMAESGVEADIKNIMYAFDSDSSALEGIEEKLFADIPYFAELTRDVYAHIIHIVAFREALRRSFEHNGIETDDAWRFESNAISTGIFRALVEARGDGKKINDAALEGYRVLGWLPSSRSIIQDWTKPFLEKSTRRSLRQLEKEYELYEKPTYRPVTNSERSGYQLFSAVKRQQDAIITKMLDGDIARARHFANQLIKSQLASGPAEYAAKSLSRLAIEARRLEQRSLEMEWAKQATELAPDDGRALGILADTYLSVFRLQEAEGCFRAALALGERSFGLNGLARTLRLSGQLEKAHTAFENLVGTLEPDDPEAWHAWWGYAGVLRDMWRFDEALAAVERALKRYPDTAPLLNVRAAVLADLGRFEEALSAYKRIIERFPNEPVAYCGLASVLVKTGALKEALSAYDVAIEKFPDQSIAVVGRAGVLSAMGDTEAAISEFQRATSRFPHDPAPHCGLAEAYRDFGKIEHAISAYDAAIRKFELNPVARSGRANALKVAGQYENALRAYDENVRLFPYDITSLGGRADLLKRLGKYEAALEAYDVIIRRHPHFSRAKTSKAAIYVAQRKYTQAAELLPTAPPRSEDDWVAHHIRGIILLRQGKLDDAERLFQEGLIGSPFYRQKRYFRAGLAMVWMRRNNFSGALDIFNEGEEAFEQLLYVHLLAGAGRMLEASRWYHAMNDNLPGTAGSLREELGARFGFLNRSPSHDESWLFEAETEVILQAA